MARSPNCTGAPLYQGRVDVSISYPDPDETLLETPVDLPTSEPAEAQISYTLASRHMPTWSPFELEHVKTAILYVAGENTSGVSRTVYYRVRKGDTSVATGSMNVPKGTVFTMSHYRFLGAQTGDVLRCSLWANGTGCNWNHGCVVVMPTRIGPSNMIVAHLSILASTFYPVLSGFGGSITGLLLQHADSDNGPYVYGTIQRVLMFSGAEYRLLRLITGDSGQGSSYATYASYFTNYVPTRIAYTPLNLRV